MPRRRAQEQGEVARDSVVHGLSRCTVRIIIDYANGGGEG
jgi:hypothetical protein